ncbi:MAG: hypothetical protein WCA20_11670 [Candidatus Sulfotelmatobacter sp.]
MSLDFRIDCQPIIGSTERKNKQGRGCRAEEEGALRAGLPEKERRSARRRRAGAGGVLVSPAVAAAMVVAVKAAWIHEIQRELQEIGVFKTGLWYLGVV